MIAMKLRMANLLIASSLLLCAQTLAQTLIYSLSYPETRASFNTRFPNGAIGASINERLAMLRNLRKTEIYSVSMSDGKRSLLFSDEGMNFEIRPTGATFGAGKAYVTGVVREWRTTPIPGAYAEPPAIYEIGLDGSRRFHKLFELRPNQGRALLNPAGSKAMFEAFENGQYTVSIYGVPAWNLLHSWDLTKLTQAHCPGCLPVSYGWLEGGDRVFFNLDLTDDDSIEPETHNMPGTYLLSEDGTDLGGIPAEIGQLQLAGYTRQKYVTPYLIGQLPDGDYLFEDHALKNGPLPKAPIELESFLVIAGPNLKAKRQFLLQKHGIRSYYLAPSGRYLAYIEDRQIPNYRTERHLWGKDLQSGEEKELFIAPPPAPPTSPEPNPLLTVLGWDDNN